jgi:hypothetical protein
MFDESLRLHGNHAISARRAETENGGRAQEASGPPLDPAWTMKE